MSVLVLAYSRSAQPRAMTFAHRVAELGQPVYVISGFPAQWQEFTAPRPVTVKRWPTSRQVRRAKELALRRLPTALVTRAVRLLGQDPGRGRAGRLCERVARRGTRLARTPLTPGYRYVAGLTHARRAVLVARSLPLPEITRIIAAESLAIPAAWRLGQQMPHATVSTAMTGRPARTLRTGVPTARP